MAQKRIKDLTTEVTSIPNDGFLPIDSLTLGTVKISRGNLLTETTSDLQKVIDAGNTATLGDNYVYISANEVQVGTNNPDIAGYTTVTRDSISMNSNGFTKFIGVGNTTDDRTLEIPDKTGVFAVTTDIPDVNYSLTEQNTGLTWIDGSPIYQRVFEMNFNDNGFADFEDSTGALGIKTVIKAEFACLYDVSANAYVTTTNTKLSGLNPNNSFSYLSNTVDAYAQAGYFYLSLSFFSLQVNIVLNTTAYINSIDVGDKGYVILRYIKF